MTNRTNAIKTDFTSQVENVCSPKVKEEMLDWENGNEQDHDPDGIGYVKFVKMNPSKIDQAVGGAIVNVAGSLDCSGNVVELLHCP